MSVTPPSSLGASADEVLTGFHRLDHEFIGHLVTEGMIVGSALRFRWQASGRLGVVVDEIGIRDASPAEIAELEEAVELGQVQIYTRPRSAFGRVPSHTVYHQATGNPLDPNSTAAKRQRARWARMDALQSSPPR